VLPHGGMFPSVWSLPHVECSLPDIARYGHCLRDGLLCSRAVGEVERQPVTRRRSWPVRLPCRRWLAQRYR
jgi:hypothetical protein